MNLTRKAINDAKEQGRIWPGYFRRAGPSTTAGVWADLSYSAGVPVANFYASTPLISAALSGREGINTGPDAAEGMRKYISRVMVVPPSNVGLGNFMLLDYCLFYPFIGGDDGFQELVNSVAMPRYGGEGCRIMAVSQNVGTGISNVIVNYTNSQGVPGRIVNATLNLAASAGSLASSTPPGSAYQYPCGPFLPMVAGDTGVLSIESTEVVSANGGTHCLVIVKPLMSIGMAEATTSPLEVVFPDDQQVVPQFENGAYLNFLLNATIAAAAPAVLAEVETIWS